MAGKPGRPRKDDRELRRLRKEQEGVKSEIKQKEARLEEINAEIMVEENLGEEEKKAFKELQGRVVSHVKKIHTLEAIREAAVKLGIEIKVQENAAEENTEKTSEVNSAPVEPLGET